MRSLTLGDVGEQQQRGRVLGIDLKRLTQRLLGLPEVVVFGETRREVEVRHGIIGIRAHV